LRPGFALMRMVNLPKYKEIFKNGLP